MNRTLRSSIVLVVLLVGCTKPKVDMSKAEDTIKIALKSSQQEAKSISCPKEIEQKAGNNFECTGETVSGMKFVAKITQKDDEGNCGVAVSGGEKPKAADSEKPKAADSEAPKEADSDEP